MREFMLRPWMRVLPSPKSLKMMKQLKLNPNAVVAATLDHPVAHLADHPAAVTGGVATGALTTGEALAVAVVAAAVAHTTTVGVTRSAPRTRFALLFGSAIAVLGSALFLLVSSKAAFWSAFSVLFYVLIYSMWLKRRTPQNIVIGGLAGSTPPLIGWAAAAGDSIAGANVFDLGSPIPWMLFFLIFLWTPPHFWALALYRSGEYGKVNIPMMNEVHGPEYTLKQSKMYCILLLLLGSVPCFWPDSGLPLLWAFVSGGLTLWYAASVWSIDPREPFDENGRMPKAAKSFFRSLFYLGWMFLSLVVITFIPTAWLGFLGPL